MMRNKKVLKASTAAILAFSALQPVMIAEASQSITDVKKDSKYYSGVQFLSKNKAFQGKLYYPENNLTKESAIQMLAKVWKVKAAKPQKGVFTNIPKNSKLHPILHGMVARGILEKTKIFDGKALVKRSELLLWSQRAFRLAPTAVQPYQDISLSSTIGKAVSALNGFDVLSKLYPNKKLSPDKIVKRGEFAQWSYILSKRKLTEMRVEQSTDQKVVINGMTYTFDQKWKKLFQSPAMKNANIVFTADQGKIISIKQLIINQNGTETTPCSLDGDNIELPQLIIKANYVQVRNFKIKQLDVLEQAKKGVTFNHVDVTEKVQVQSSGMSQKKELASPILKSTASLSLQKRLQGPAINNREVIKSYDDARVLFIDSDVEELIVTHPNTSVIISKGAVVKKVVLSANARIETNQDAVIEQLLIKRGTLYAEIAGTIQNCRVEAPTELEVVKDAVIQTLSTAEEATIQGAGKVDQLRIENRSKSIELNIAIQQLEIVSSEPIELLGKPVIGSLKIGELATSVSLKVESNIPEVVIEAKTAKVDIGTGVQITSLQIPVGANVTDLITNYEKVEDQIKNPPVVTPPTPGGGTTTPPTPGGGTTTPPTPGGETTTPPTPGGGTTTPPTPGGETTTPPTPGGEEVEMSEELDQVLDMKGDRYAVFDLTKELLDKLILSNEIEEFDPSLIEEYRFYITNMSVEEFESAQDLKRVLKKVKEVHEVNPSEEQPYLLTPVSYGWEKRNRYQLSIETIDYVRVYFKKDGKLVKMETIQDNMDPSYYGDFETVDDGYEIPSFYHYDEIVFEKKDGSYSHLTMNKDSLNEESGNVKISTLNGKEIKLPDQIYKGVINEIKENDVNESNGTLGRYNIYDFDHFKYYEFPEMSDAIDVGFKGNRIDNSIHRIYIHGDKSKNEKGTAVIGILKSLYRSGSFQGNWLIPGYAATPFTSTIDSEIETDKPFQVIIERNNRDAFLNHLGFSLNEKNISYPIRLETIDGQPLSLDNVEISKVNDDESVDFSSDTTALIEDGKLNITLGKSGRDTYLIEVGELKQKFSIDVWETFESKAMNVSKIKSREAALELIRRAIILRDVDSLPIDLFKKIDSNYTLSGLDFYKQLLNQIQVDHLEDLDTFVEETMYLNQILSNLSAIAEDKISLWSPSIYVGSGLIKLMSQEDSFLLSQKPDGQIEKRSRLDFDIQTRDEKYFIHQKSNDIEQNGMYTFYEYDDEKQTFEKFEVEFGNATKGMIEILTINGLSVEEYIKSNSVTNEGTPPSDEGTPPSDEGTPPSDEGTPPSDEGTPPSDEGTPPSDEGTPPSDEGTPPSDEGTPPSDEGTPPSDEGTPSSDEGTPSSDEGTSSF